MKAERTLCITGEEPLLIVAPHGIDDANTDILAERIADNTGCYAVINKGWKRAKSHDYWTNHADLNDITHCHEDVVKEEFLDPILQFKNLIIQDFGYCQVFNLHGFGGQLDAQKKEVDFIVGYGDDPLVPHYTCREDVKDAFCYICYNVGFNIYVSRSTYAGRRKNNLNQLFRQWYPCMDVNSIQLEISNHLRGKQGVRFLADELSYCMEELLEYDDSKLKTINYSADII